MPDLTFLCQIRDELTDMGIGTDKPISGVDAVEYLYDLLIRVNKRLSAWFPEQYTAGREVLDAVERVNAVYDADAENDVIHDAVVSLADAYKTYRAANPTWRAADPAPSEPARTIIVTGNPVDGLEFIGPFASDDAAISVAEKWSQHEVDWWIATLQPEGA